MVCRVFVVDIHPDMKTVIVAELERLLYRPHIAAKAQSVCMCIWRLLLYLILREQMFLLSILSLSPF